VNGRFRDALGELRRLLEKAAGKKPGRVKQKKNRQKMRSADAKNGGGHSALGNVGGKGRNTSRW